MNKNLMKTGILSLLLVVPVLFIIFLNTGKNTYQLERFRDIEGKPTKYLLNEDGQPHKLPPFSFVDQNGKLFTEKDIAGKVVIADYVFTRCQTICPVMSSNLENVQRAFADNPDVVLLSHTVDPEYDSVPILNSYAKMHGALTGKWFFLTGEKSKLYKHAAEGYKIVASEEATGPDAFVHSDRIVLLDKNGYIRGYYNGTDSMQVDTLILETKIVLSELK